MVESAYSEWSLINSGKVEASKALFEVKRLKTDVDQLSKRVTEVHGVVKSAKTLADRVSSRQSQSKDSGGGGKAK